jgi:hypothetical protein
VIDELNREIELKRRELGADVPLDRVLEALVRDAAETWQMMLVQGASFDHGLLMKLPQDDVFVPGFQSQTIATFERAYKRTLAEPNVERLAAATKMRRFCTVVTKIPPLIRPASKVGIGSDAKLCWLLVWLLASNMPAPEVAQTLQWLFDRRQQSLKRDRIWKIRAKVFRQLAAAIKSSSQEQIRAAA